MTLHSTTQAIGILALAAVTGFTNPASATVVLEVQIDASALTGAAQLAFDLTDGDGFPNNTVIVMDTAGGGE